MTSSISTYLRRRSKMLGNGAQQIEGKMDEKMQNDVSEKDEETQVKVEEVDPPEIIEWERNHDILCHKIFKLSEIQATMEYSKQAEDNVSVCQEMSSLKHSNPLLVKYLERQIKDAEIAINEAIDHAQKSIEESLFRIFYFIDYMFKSNYQVLPTSLTDVVSQNEPDTVVKIEDINKKQGPFSLRKIFFSLTEYQENASAIIEFTNDKRFQITTRLTKLYPSPRITYVLKAQRGSEESQDVVKTCPARLRPTEVNFDVVNYTRSFSVLENYDLEKPFSIEIHVEPPGERDNVLCRSGFLVWSIDNYSERKRNEKAGLVKYHLGPYFYTRTGQCRIQVKMYLNGHCKWRKKIQNDEIRKNSNQSQNDETRKDNENDGAGENTIHNGNWKRGLTAGIVFLISEFDSVPRLESVPLKVAITVFNSEDLSQRIKKSLIVENFDKLYIDIENDEEVGKLIINDTLYYKINIVDVPKTND